MSKKPEPIGEPQTPDASPTIVENVPSRAGQISALASAGAPFIYFDNVPFFGSFMGVGQITITAQRFVAVEPNGNCPPDHVVTGLLRAPLPALRLLRNAIDAVERKILEEEAAKAAPAAIIVPPGKAH